MDNFVQINDELYVNLTEAVKVAVKGTVYIVYIREGDGSLTEHYCSPGNPGYAKLQKLLKKAQ